MTQFPHTRTYPMKRRKWLIAALIAAVLFCFLGTIAAYVTTTQPDVDSVTTAPAPIAKPVGKQPAKAAARAIGGDDLVHVGEDVPAGVYRAVTSVDGDSCYWLKSKDAEGSNIIDNDLPSGGRPQVTLKNGQWFKSQGCPDWAVAK